MSNRLTRDQRRIIFAKVFSVIAWYGGLFLLLRGYVLIFMRRTLFGWHDVPFEGEDAWAILHIIAAIAIMNVSSRRLNDKLTRAITVLPVLPLSYGAYFTIDSWMGETLNPGVLFGRRVFTPVWYVIFEFLIFILPLGLWLLAFEDLRETARKAISNLVQVLLGEKEGSPIDPTATNESRGASSGDSSKQDEKRHTKDDSDKHENKSKHDTCDATTRLRGALATLGLGGRATRTEIRESYRDLAQVWHPDRFAHNPRLQANAQRKLSEINNAYDLLEEFFNKKTRS